ncbi:MAG: 5-dehydro-4-deoxy-D-glucuronate isomerase, partial [Oscillospiraceae bacterium]|nr:5-dehydro-4-deoxy-D-glucuronate isomerase [Oscillospiraceae bacterium]
MDIRYSAGIKDFKRYTTDETRDEFLITGLYKADEVVAVYSHIDRMVTLGCMPVNEVVSVDKGMDVWANFGTKFFLERRELGMFNIGGPGTVTADGTKFNLNYKDCLYITRGTEKITFQSVDPKNPAKFYMVSAPAHKAFETKFISIEDAAKNPVGAVETANKRVINQFIHPDVVQTAQLMMGLTCLDPGSVWNTMPSHTHERRMEIYTYFEIPENNVVFHLMGSP